ncbi:hypothetical protein ACFL2R_02555 [Patescibacteria group bacterium]
MFLRIDLRFKESDNVHRREIVFEEDCVDLIKVYNAAISEVCNKTYDLGIFHQTGRGNDTGYHAWEFLKTNPNEEIVNLMIAEIHQKAEEDYSDLKRMNLI